MPRVTDRSLTDDIHGYRVWNQHFHQHRIFWKKTVILRTPQG